MTESEKLVARFEQKMVNGLVDNKFFVNPDVALTMEEFCACANRIEASIAAGNCARHDTWNEKLPKHDIGKILA